MSNSNDIISLTKRRGFIFPSSEIYGGYSSTYDYGPLGAQVMKNIKDLWWKSFVLKNPDVVGMDGAIFSHPKTWEASGHVGAFNDPLVEDKETHIRYRADHLIEDVLEIDTSKMSFEEMQKVIDENDIRSPDGNDLTKIKAFNQLVEAKLGATDETKSKAYLRGETCQVIFLQYLNVLQSMRKKVPFGIAQMGKAFRNEITTKDFIYRTREFEQMELEYFIHPDEGDKWYEYWEKFMLDWFVNELGMSRDSFRYREIPKEEMSHYAKIQKDFEFKSSSGKWFELSPLNHRGDYDLSNHMKHSGVDFTYTDPISGEKFIPNVIEISIGVNRVLYSLLDNAYTKDGERVLLKLHPNVAPYQVAVFPLVKNKPEIVEKAKSVFDSLIDKGYRVDWDERGNVGKRYFSQDEIGTPKCITIDYDTLEDNTVTIRDRDTTEQIRCSIDEIDSRI